MLILVSLIHALIMRSSISSAHLQYPYSTGVAIVKNSEQGISVDFRPPSLLITMDEICSHKFLHHDFHMFRCIWGKAMMTDEKASVFADMDRWLDTYNVSLTADFVENDDWYAWCIYQCE